MTRKQTARKRPRKSEGGGEGNREADRRYREDATRFARSGRVEDAADSAEAALEREDEAEELREAEERGRAPARD
jgi:hypothetical protein